MDSGSLVEEGTHQELIQQQGRYLHCIHSRRQTLTDPQQPESKSLPPKVKTWEGSSAYVEQGCHWSLCFDLLSAVLSGTLIWAFTAKIDQTVTVRGRLEPSGSVRDVESPSAGVVSKVFVKDGEVVKQGQLYLTSRQKGLSSRRKALETTLLYIRCKPAH